MKRFQTSTPASTYPIPRKRLRCSSALHCDLEYAAELLIQDGVVVIPTPFCASIDSLSEMESGFDDAIGGMPEFRDSYKSLYATGDNSVHFVKGSFAALGNPSSFHNPFVRHIRSRLHGIVSKLMSIVLDKASVEFRIDSSRYKFHQFMDRMLMRPAKVKVSPESFHRDTPYLGIGSVTEDMTFGGWINLNSDCTQYFSCVKGDYLRPHDPRREAKGFSKISKEEAALLRKKSSKVSIPPGHTVIFFENILHEVLASSSKKRMKRLFLGWRLTPCDDFIVPDFLDRMKSMDSIPLKSGQEPTMYRPLHWCNYRDKLAEWATKALVPEYQGTRVMKSGEFKGKTYPVPRQLLPGDKQDQVSPQIPLSKSFPGYYPDYTEEELRLFVPSRDFLEKYT